MKMLPSVIVCALAALCFLVKGNTSLRASATCDAAMIAPHTNACSFQRARLQCSHWKRSPVQCQEPSPAYRDYPCSDGYSRWPPSIQSSEPSTVAVVYGDLRLLRSSG